MSKTSGGSSGMAQVDPTTYIAVYDLKVFEEGPRVSLIRTYSDSIKVDPIRISNWETAGGISSDLEAICGVPGRENEYLLSESGNWQGKGGRIFHIKFDRTKLSAEILGSTVIPMQKINDFDMTGDQYEGIAALENSENKVTLILTERGGSVVYPQGLIRWALYDLSEHSIQFTDNGLKGIPIDAPGNWADPTKNRDLTDLRIDKQGRVWTAGSQDLGDAGPFYSTIFQVGTLSGNPNQPINVLENLTAWRELPGFKIEALSGASLIAPGSVISFGTEDEFYGGVWRAIQ